MKSSLYLVVPALVTVLNLCVALFIIHRHHEGVVVSPRDVKTTHDTKWEHQQTYYDDLYQAPVGADPMQIFHAAPVSAPLSSSSSSAFSSSRRTSPKKWSLMRSSSTTAATSSKY
mmetsp:Transcript_9074/g.16467  ORF Transcript_9074/g.16467 Transcript_9074/m.16467 type:complete len:115 (-) Transcript_9074:316-660(-)|eukprot:CAMPEP_0178765472 /NCGR_PEP_ID=MMETSP0744-20121128/18470_1 /TAXON_ID=913974 /ORGANISM="Nitzschia punctata, Strain CCMP561" /LENGTH=114 /DNA_ID=CAMNT_0020420971 /DNA_START=269 /DNA_END=613 /DNA_ORIENTATION=+